MTNQPDHYCEHGRPKAVCGECFPSSPLTFTMDGVTREIGKVHGLVEPKPLTEEELGQAEDRARAWPLELPKYVVYSKWHETRREDTERLIAEVRRLRALHYDQVLDDIGALLEALGKPNVARPESPQAVMRECIEAVRGLRALAICPNCGEAVTEASLYHARGNRCRLKNGEWWGDR